MKVVFPDTGSIIIEKNDLVRLRSFYNLTLAQSPLRNYLQTSNNVMQIEQFYYLPQKSAIILKNAHPLTILKMRALMDQSKKAYEERMKKIQMEKEMAEKAEKKITDNEFLTNSFFTTFKQVS